MTSPRLERRLRRAALSAAVCGGALLLAAALPAPTGFVDWGAASFGIDLQPAAADTIPLRPGVVDVGEATGKPRLLNGLQVQRLLQDGYPPLLRDAGITGTVQVQMVVGESGEVVEARVVETSRPELAAPAEQALRQARFAPATKDGRRVAVRVQVPVAFQPGEGSVETRGATPPATQVGEAALDVAELDTRPVLRNAQEVQRVLQEGYPPLLRDAGISGSAQVAFVVTTEGTTRDVRLVSATHEAFGELAVAAVRAMRMTPGTLRGRAAEARVQVPVSFSLAPPDSAAAGREP